ncbi:hypothetical protein F-liban_270 [Faustovirus]|nr:hypothetical protein F-liban_270 [Faustovirus]
MSFESVMASYLLNRKIDLVTDAVNGIGFMASYYNSGKLRLGNKSCKIQRDTNGKILNKGRLVKIMLSKCAVLKQFALRTYVEFNININNPDKINYCVINKLPPIMVEIEKSTPDEADAAIYRYDVIAPNDAKWVHSTLQKGVFKLNDLNAMRYKIMQQSVDMLEVMRYSFRFLHLRADYYFGVHSSTTPTA